MKLLKWLSVAERFAKTYLDNQLAPLGINSSQYMYLIRICDQPGLLQDSLIESFYIHPSNIVRMIAALEKKGLIRKQVYDQDKRTSRLYPTEKALSIVDNVRAICDKTEALMMDGIDPREQADFQRILLWTGKNITRACGMERKDDAYDA